MILNSKSNVQFQNIQIKHNTLFMERFRSWTLKQVVHKITQIYLTVYGKYGRNQEQCNSNRYQTLGPHTVQVNIFSAQGQAYPFRHALGSSVAIPAIGAQNVEIVTRISWCHRARDKFSNRPKGPEKDIWSILYSSLDWGLLSTVFLLDVSIETLRRCVCKAHSEASVTATSITRAL